MTIKAMLIVGEFNYDGLDWQFNKQDGLIIKKNNLGGITNFFRDAINNKFFIIPLLNEVGIVVNNVTQNTSISETYINSSSSFFNNQYLKDNELISSVNLEASQYKVNFSINSIVDNNNIPLIQKLAKGYIDFLYHLFNNKFATKNIIQFKNQNGDGRTFQVENMGLVLSNIDEYQTMIELFKGNFKNIITECDKLANSKTNNKFNYYFIKRLAIKEYDFVGNTFFTDSTETVEQTTITNLDLITFIDVMNEWYKSNLDKNNINDDNNKLAITPIIDYRNCLYVDTKGNFIMNAKIVGMNKVNGSASNSLDTYELTISPKIQGSYIPPANKIKRYENKNDGVTPNINDDVKVDRLGLKKLTFTKRI